MLPSSEPTLPLLLLPFTPSQILLPGQCSKLTFRHGKYMDMIDEALTSYESVLGLSLLDEDGLLPVVVICEVLEEEVLVKSGFRGVISMEVGLQAVGRACRWDGAGGIGIGKDADNVGRNVGIDSFFHGRTALDDIHLGRFVEWHDDVLDDAGLDAAGEYSRIIESFLMLSSSPPTPISLPSASSYAVNKNVMENQADVNDQLHRQQLLYDHANEVVLRHLTSNTLSSCVSRASAPSEQQQQSKLIAASWAVFSAIESNAKTASTITQALLTTDTAERLRLGLGMMLNDRIPIRETSVPPGELEKDVDGDFEENAFQ